MRLVEVVNAAFTDPNSDESIFCLAYQQCINWISEFREKQSEDETLSEIDQQSQNESVTDAKSQADSLLSQFVICESDKDPQFRERIFSGLQARNWERAGLTFEQQNAQDLALSKMRSKPDPDDIKNY